MARVLVVEDSQIDRRIVEGLLGGHDDLSLEFVEDGAAALSRVGADPPDLVLTDLYMPGMDGLELVAAVKERHPRVPIVLMTSKGNEQTAVKALKAGAASYVPKRSLARSLEGTLREVLELASRQRSEARLLDSLEASESKFRIANQEELVSPLVKHLSETAELMGICEPGEGVQVGIALCEALNNAMEHGNLEVGSDLKERDFAAYSRLMRERSRVEPYRDRRILVTAQFSRESARFVVRDEGPGFDPRDLPDPRDPENLDRSSGRGIFLIRAFMDEVSFNAGGNEITMVKYRGT